jgi:aminoglycoside phosphotransferase (APT) family kinase protein
MSHDADWARAKRALRAAFEPATEIKVEIDVGFAKFLGGGLTRRAFAASIDLSPDPKAQSGTYVALIPSPGAPDYDENIRREFELLRWLARQSMGVRTPRAVALVDDGGTSILVETFVEGLAVDLRAGRKPVVRPWEFVAEVAADIHAVPPPPHMVPRTRQEHRLELIGALERASPRPALVDEAVAWMRDHVGPSLPGVILHGDLLGQNLRIDPEGGPGVIDWHHAQVGDPAEDLAIVTRGVRRPFQIDGGRQKLLDSYNQRASIAIDTDSLRFFELALLCSWVVDPGTEQHLTVASLNQIARMLRAEPD